MVDFTSCIFLMTVFFFVIFFLLFFFSIILLLIFYRRRFYEITNFQIIYLFSFRMKLVLFHLFTLSFALCVSPNRDVASLDAFDGQSVQKFLKQEKKNNISFFPPDDGGRCMIANHSIHATLFN